MNKTIKILFLSSLIACTLRTPARTDCPKADINADCFVDLHDFAAIANQWLTGDQNIPDNMIHIPAGGFEMGDHFAEGTFDELPLHPILINDFFISKFETTNQQYSDFLNAAFGTTIYISDGIVYGTINNQIYCYTSIDFYTSQINFADSVFSVKTKPPIIGRDMSLDPACMITWFGAVAYCNWLSENQGYQQCYDLSTWQCDFSKQGYRLPTEAEWKYAARGGQQNPYYRFPWGNTICHDNANYYANPNDLPYDVNPTPGFHPDYNDGIWPYTSPVGSFPPNGFGLYDMIGNASEWCQDKHSDTYYNTAPYNNPTGPTIGIGRTMSSENWAADPYWSRISARYYTAPDSRGISFGFRVALNPQ
jgi:formylglycine-generating enzyme required for sulfatase activity